ncbi:hypothetical protein [Streptomyces antnestii]|nr:hypothetical protein [Streptomyces sp. San01]
MQRQLADVKHLIVAVTQSPVSFFAYPDKARDLVPEGRPASLCIS